MGVDWSRARRGHWSEVAGSDQLVMPCPGPENFNQDHNRAFVALKAPSCKAPTAKSATGGEIGTSEEHTRGQEDTPDGVVTTAADDAARIAHSEVHLHRARRLSSTPATNSSSSRSFHSLSETSFILLITKTPLFSDYWRTYLFGQFACSPFYGALSERLGRRPVLLICVVISTIFLIAFGFSESYILSVVLRLLQGAFAGALTVGKLYLADISDATNEGKVFSYIGIAIGSGCITGPAIGGYLADPALLHPLFPKATAVGGVIRAYPYLAPCAAGALVSIVLFFVALFKLTESRPPTIPLFKSKARNGSAGRLSHKASPTASPGPLGAPLLPNAQQGASAGCGATMPVRSQSMFEAVGRTARQPAGP